MRLRRATPADIPSMRDLERRNETAADWSAAQYDALFAADAQIRIALIAAEHSTEPEIRGFLIARCLSDEWEIENIIVDERFRRSGVGSSLVQDLLAGARSAGVASIILEVRESNLPALRLYESIGFKPEGRRKNYYQDPVEDAVLYSLSVANL
jgi:ribosomal-protein-alanine N-acetyltransferase